MVFIKLIIIGVILLVIPYLLGNLISYKESGNLLKSLISRYILGLFTSLSLFWILCVPMTLLKITFSTLIVSYSILLIILCTISILLCFKRNPPQDLSLKQNKIPFRNTEKVFFIIFSVFAIIQLYFATFYESTVWSYDDYDYIVRSLDTITSNHMHLTNIITGNEIRLIYKRALTSWEIYIAYISKLSGFHVTTIAHTIFPPFFLVVAYSVYYYIADQLFHKREDKLIFLCVLSCTIIFGLYSPYALSFRLLVALWQGKAILSAIVIPFLIFFLPNLYMNAKKVRSAAYLSIISAAACSLTMMGSGMTIAVYFIMLIVISLYKRHVVGLPYFFSGCIVPILHILLYLTMR